MSDQALILHDATRRHFEISSAAESLKAAALEQAGLIMRVENPKQNEAATETQKALKELLNLAEKTRVIAKEPSILEGRLCDKVMKGFTAELQGEYDRIGEMAGNYLALEKKKQEAALAARNEELSQLDRDKAQEILNLGDAATIDKLNEIDEHYNALAKELAEANPLPKPVRASGQVGRSVWQIEIENIHVLYENHPQCVKLEALRGEITLLLDAGVIVPGVKAMKLTRSDVRPGKVMVVEA